MVNHDDELKHYGVKGMKWDEDKKKQAEQEFDKLVALKHLTKAQAARVKALAKKLQKVKSSKVSDAKKEVGKAVNIVKRTAETASEKVKRVKKSVEKAHEKKQKQKKQEREALKKHTPLPKDTASSLEKINKKWEKHNKKYEKSDSPQTVTTKDRAKAFNKKLKKEAAKREAKKKHDKTLVGKVENKINKAKDKLEKLNHPKEKKPHGKIVDPGTTARKIKEHNKPLVDMDGNTQKEVDKALKRIGLKKKTTKDKVADSVKTVKAEAGIAYERVKVAQYRKTHDGENPPFDPTNKNQWRLLGRELGLTKSPTQKTKDKIKKKLKSLRSN